MLLVLKRSPEREVTLNRLLESQQDQGSPSYHQWLTPEQFGAQFGPADSDVQAVTAWLQSNGFEVAAPAHGHTVVEFSGTAAQVQQAFHTTIHQYMVDGVRHWANATDPQIPAALAPAVAGVVSLHNFRPRAQHQNFGTFTRDRSTGQVAPSTGAAPLYTIYGACGGSSCHALGPYDFATIYGVLPLWTAGVNGSGQTIAIAGETNIDPQDDARFRSIFGLPARSSSNPLNVILDGPDPGKNDEELEADIDVQWAGAVAPAAAVDLVVSQSTETTAGIDLSALYIIDHNLAPVLSVSYGQCELALGTAGNQFYNTLWQQAAAQGITVFVAAGDQGSAGCDYANIPPPQPALSGLAVNGLASTPFNVAVGGTDFNDVTTSATYWNGTSDPVTAVSAKSYIPEVPWNSTCASTLLSSVGFGTDPIANCGLAQLVQFVDTVAGSGGPSTCTSNLQSPGSCTAHYPKPAWQTGSGVPSDGARDLPDVSLFASNGFTGSFYMVCRADGNDLQTCNLSEPFYTFEGVGGTSVSSPAFAGIMALINQKTGARQGNANYGFYKLSAQQSASACSSSSPDASCVFHDVTTGSIAVPCRAGTPDCHTENATESYGVLSGYIAGSGYDLATGLGTVNAANLVNHWSTLTSFATVTALNSLTPATVAHGQPVSFSAGVTPQSGNGTPTGQIVLVGGPSGGAIASYSLSGGQAAGSTTLLPGGSYSVSAHYSGDGTYSPSDSSSVPVNVTAEPSRTLANLVTTDINGHVTSFSATGGTYGAGYNLLRFDVGDAAIAVSASGISSNCTRNLSSCPTGVLSIASTGAALPATSLMLNVQGSAEIGSALAPGNYSVSAVYPGDTSYGASSASLNFAIAQAPVTLSAGSSNNQQQYGVSTSLGVDVHTTSNGVAPTGTFVFMIDGAPVGTPIPVYESGRYVPGHNPPAYAWADAQTSTVLPAVGPHTFNATYSGDSNYASATSPLLTLNVGRGPTSFGGVGAAFPVAGQPATITASVTGGEYGALPPSGTIDFFVDGVAVAANETYTSNAAPPHGLSSLSAAVPYVFTTAGPHNLSASYSGDNNYLPSSWAPYPETVLAPFTVTANGQVNIASPGASGSTTVTVAPVGGFTGTVTLSCQPSSYAHETTCGFGTGSSQSSTAQVNLAGASATLTLNVTTTAPHTVAVNRGVPAGGLPPSVTPMGGIALAGVLTLLAPATYRRRRIFMVFTPLGLCLALGACGGGGSSKPVPVTDSGTAAASYTFTIQAASGTGTTALSSSTDFTVWVQ